VLIVYLEPFQAQQYTLLASWTSYVRYWPRSYAHIELDQLSVATDWWMLFADTAHADIWLIKYPEQSRIIRTLFDT
jgi:hypothetical protein